MTCEFRGYLVAQREILWASPRSRDSESEARPSAALISLHGKGGVWRCSMQLRPTNSTSRWPIPIAFWRLRTCLPRETNSLARLLGFSMRRGCVSLLKTT